MYIAEIKGKLPSQFEGWEDVLTSNVFSFFKYSSRTLYLKRFLNKIGINDIIDNDLETAEFIFWPIYPDGTEPDVVLLVGKYYLLFEAKYGADFGDETADRKQQLIREIEGGLVEAGQIQRTFQLIAITADACYRPEKFKDVPTKYKQYVQWTNWQTVAGILKNLINDNSCLSTEELFAKDLFSLLERKNLRGFQSFRGMSFTGESLPKIFFEASTATYRGDFLGFQKALASLIPIGSSGNRLFFRKQFFKSLYMMSRPVPEQIFYHGR